MPLALKTLLPIAEGGGRPAGEKRDANMTLTDVENKQVAERRKKKERQRDGQTRRGMQTGREDKPRRGKQGSTAFSHRLLYVYRRSPPHTALDLEL